MHVHINAHDLYFNTEASLQVFTTQKVAINPAKHEHQSIILYI